jgi:hypothetical protein
MARGDDPPHARPSTRQRTDGSVGGSGTSWPRIHPRTSTLNEAGLPVWLDCPSVARYAVQPHFERWSQSERNREAGSSGSASSYTVGPVNFSL